MFAGGEPTLRCRFTPDAFRRERDKGAPVSGAPVLLASTSCREAWHGWCSKAGVEKRYADIELEADSVLVYQPRFVDEQHTVVAAFIRLPNGQLIEVEKDYADESSRFVRDIRRQYTFEEILAFTERERAMVAKKLVVDEATAERSELDLAQFQISEARRKAFEIPEVAACTDERVLKRMREAASPFEIAALCSNIIGRAFEVGR